MISAIFEIPKTAYEMSKTGIVYPVERKILKKYFVMLENEQELVKYLLKTILKTSPSILTNVVDLSTSYTEEETDIYKTFWFIKDDSEATLIRVELLKWDDLWDTRYLTNLELKNTSLVSLLTHPCEKIRQIAKEDLQHAKN